MVRQVEVKGAMHTALSAVARDSAFQETGAPHLLLDPDLRIQAANPAYLRATGRALDELVGAYMFDAFPDNPTDPTADGVHNLSASLETVMRSSRRHRMWVQRYDVPGRTPEDDFVLKYWCPVNSPVRDDRARVAGVLHHVEDVTPLWARAFQHELGGPDDTYRGDDGHKHAATLLSALGGPLAHCKLAYQEVVAENTQLHQALTSRVVIEEAKGVLMAERHCGPDEAFSILRTHARNARRNIHDVAAEVVESAQRGQPPG